MSHRSLNFRTITAGLVASLAAVIGFAAFASASHAQSTAGSYFQSQLKAKGSKKAAEKATMAAMKGDKGFYGFKLKAKDIPAKNGTLIWAKKGSKNRPEAGRTDVVLYSSRSVFNKKIPVSGTVMVPKGKAPKGGWPVISWAHGTTGLADQCAPSRRLGDTAYYGSESGELVANWLKSGYAVLSTDYEGLGTPGVHPYLVGDSEGRGVLDIVRAARELNPKIGKQVVLTGHSQGGQAILFAAKLATTSWGKGSNYLGTVSYAPASNLVPQANLLTNNPGFDGQWGLSALALAIVRGMTIGNPAIDAEPLMTAAGLALYPKTDTVCLDELTVLAQNAGLDPGELFKPGWQSTADGARMIEALNAANPAVKVGAPVMIPQGLSDGTVQPTFTGQLITQLEGLNNPSLIDYVTYPGATHSSVLAASRADVDNFVKALLNP